MTITDSLAKNLDLIMKSRNLSAMKLSSLIPVSSASIKKIRTGENKNPTIDVLSTIASYFGLTLSQITNEYDYLEQQNVHNVPVNGVNQTNKIVPIINWQEAAFWPSTKHVSHPHNLVTENHKLSEKAFALIIDTDEYVIFERGSIVIVEPAIEFVAKDYVLIQKQGENPTIRKIIQDAGTWFFQSVVPGVENAIKFTPEYKILGVVVASKKWLKKID